MVPRSEVQREIINAASGVAGPTTTEATTPEE